MDPDARVLESRIKGSLWGLPVGDALGAPYEVAASVKNITLLHANDRCDFPVSSNAEEHIRRRKKWRYAKPSASM